MTRKLIAVATALGAAVLLTATAADAAKTPKNYVDNDGSGTWSAGDVDLKSALADGIFLYTEVSNPSGRGVVNVVLGDAKVDDFITNGSVTINGKVRNASSAAPQVTILGADIVIADGAKIDGNAVEIRTTGAVTMGDHVNLSGDSVKVTAGSLTIGDNAKLTAKVNDWGGVGLYANSMTIGKGLTVNVPTNNIARGPLVIDTNGNLLLDTATLNGGWIYIDAGDNLHIRDSKVTAKGYNGKIWLDAANNVLQRTKVKHGPAETDGGLSNSGQLSIIN